MRNGLLTAISGCLVLAIFPAGALASPQAQKPALSAPIAPTSDTRPNLATMLLTPSNLPMIPVQTGEQAFNGNYSGTHQVALLDDGAADFEARLRMIEHAQSEVDIESYIFDQDTAGRLLLQALIARKRKVEQSGHPFRVRILVDRSHIRQEKGLELGTVQELQRNGIEVKFFNDSAFPTHYNYRSHKKVFLVDGKEFITGGRNLQERYFGFDSTSGQDHYNYYDTDIYVRGPAASGAQGAFEAFWASDLSSTPDQRPVNPDARRNAQSILETSPDLQQSLAMIQAKGSAKLKDIPVFESDKITFLSDKPGPSRENRRTEVGVMRMSQQAQQSLILENWVMDPIDDQRAMFDDLLTRHVLVDLVTNSYQSRDGSWVYFAAQNRILQLDHQGMHTYELAGHPTNDPGLNDYQNQHALWGTHAKVACADSKNCFIGSANNDPRSKYINAEAGVIVNDNPAFAQEVQNSIAWRLQDAYPMTPDGHYLGTISSVANGECIRDLGPSLGEDALINQMKGFAAEVSNQYQ